MIDLTSAVLLLITGMCIPKLFRILLPTSQKINSSRCDILSSRLDHLSLYLNEVSVRAGILTRADADEYKLKLDKIRNINSRIKRELEGGK